MDTQRMKPSDRAWLPNLDLHAEGGALVLHIEAQDLRDEMAISFDCGDLIVQAEGEREEPLHLPLPFSLKVPPVVCRQSSEILEVRIPIPDGGRS